ncbi:major tail protein [Lacrimispora sp. NSJ-141]|uniref:Major tail protein n=1 Tax=Lientehia hominis TaxID=2897778 RepID=A0AAP2WAJ4_9FIRM|nr:major tail protein [Lientehia hominis]MCD2493314.1 major tail protein [Lientehia hominis]
MAFIGLTKPTVAVLEEGKEGVAYSKGFRFGKAIEVEISPKYADTSVYKDVNDLDYGQQLEYADISLNTATIPDRAEEIIFGHAVSAAEGSTVIRYRTGDEAGYVGFGISAEEKVDGMKKYVAIWLYKVRFYEDSQSYKTKEDSIDYITPSISGRILPITSGEWKEKRIFTTKEQALAWLDKMAGLN